ncbi:hypothetical protein EYZ11_006331 [Aspergillus tanneri]|uniref:Quinate transporter n=1 Tax=Aspergillus tanneri TaxID=1220188 RepID=A0A4S3JG42_9EURO|nr:hypothetical protein EYZ11_006331 [Aspergillus tanneri]
MAEPQPNAPSSGHSTRVYFLVIVTSMGAFLFGYDLAFIGASIELPSFEKSFGLQDASTSTSDAFAANIVSLLQAGCFFGSLVAAPLSDMFGRRLALGMAGAIFCIGSTMQVVSSGIEAIMFVGRALGGLGVGASSMLVPLYTAECAPPAIRGRLVGVFEIGVQVGMCIGFWINYAVDQTIASSSRQWMTPFAIQLVPGGLLLIGLAFLTDSPRWTARKGREAVSQTLAYLRGIPAGHPAVQAELNDIMNQLEDERTTNPGKGIWVEIKECMHPGVRERLLLGNLVMVFFQMAGSNAINYYSPRIFQSIGMTGTQTKLISTGVYGLAFCMWFLGAFVKLHGVSHTDGKIDSSSYAAAVFIFVYAVAFCFSWAGIPWVICSEIYPLRVRALCVAVCTGTHWLLNFVLARSVPYMITNISFGTYFIFASFLTLSIPFVWFMVPETKGLKLEEVDEVFRDRTFWGKSRSREGRALDVECAEEKGDSKEIEDVNVARKYWLNTLPD